MDCGQSLPRGSRGGCSLCRQRLPPVRGSSLPHRPRSHHARAPASPPASLLGVRRNAVNAPASPREVTVPPMAREAGEGARRPRRLGEARKAALEPGPGILQGLARSDFPRPGAARRVEPRREPGLGERRGSLQDARPASVKPHLVRDRQPPSSPGPRPGLGVGLSSRLAVAGARTWGRQHCFLLL